MPVKCFAIYLKCNAGFQSNLYYTKNACIHMYTTGAINFFLFMMILRNELMNMTLLSQVYIFTRLTS